MKITYYGTAAGEGWPGIFCRCELCREARRLGGKNIRTRSQALINDDLLLDIPPDNYLHSLHYGLDLDKVRILLITHSHSDHFYPEDLEFLREPFSHTYPAVMQVYGNGAIRQGIQRTQGTLGGEKTRFMFHEASGNAPFSVGGYTVLPLYATHTKEERCLFYRIAQGDKAVLYAHDTGVLTQENFEALAQMSGKLSLVSLDCTTQKERDGGYHMGLLDAAEQKERLLERGLADRSTIWVVNHFSHNGGWLHEEMAAQAQKYGMLASYDGMSIEF
jgi:phosphoribosyl 1,2-cyclic phosphate phosphodiesterase